MDKAEAVCQACAGVYEELDRYAAATMRMARRQLENLMEVTLDETAILREPVTTLCLHLACSLPQEKAESQAVEARLR